MAAEYIELVPVQQSIAKKKEAQSKDLGVDEQFIVDGNKPLLIDGYDVGAKGHYKVHLWGSPHKDLGDSAYLWPGHYKSFPELLKINQNTVLKKDPKKQSKDLAASDLMPAKKGQLIVIREAGEVVNKCIQVELVTDSGNTEKWWAFLGDKEGEGHCECVGTDPTNDPKDKPTTSPEQRKKQRSFKTTAVPGISQLEMYDPVHRESAQNIFWYELLHFDGKNFRCPENAAVTQRIIALAKDLQWIRDNCGGGSMTINSGYRDPETNRRVGGARNSRHIYGDACDYTVAGIHPHKMNDWLCSSRLANNGIASASVFTHYDRRSYRARWSYGF
ncbi:MAG: D-Ala-D-Ala carboxypeptidase family metallohydrolase [Cyanobacteria bacterium P01_F01_bin.13]